MAFIQRFKTYVGIALFGGVFVFVDWIEPLDKTKGLLLFFLGAFAADLLRKEPAERAASWGPSTSWDQMYVTDRLNYFMPALICVVVGVILVFANYQDSVVLSAGAALSFGLAIAIAAQRWYCRHHA